MAEKRPNILLITCDQLRWDYVGCYGVNPWMETPNIDSLAEDGCRFENAYSPNPVCLPARHNMITGLPAKYHGFDDNYFGADAKNCPWELPTFAQMCSDAGYSTFAVGKMHFQPERRATGFDRFLNMDEVITDVMEDDYALFLREKGYGDVGSLHGVRGILYQQPQQSLLPDELTGSHWVADRVIDILEKRAVQDRPFLIWAGFIQPHPPLASPHSWSHKYDGKVPPRAKSRTPLTRFSLENQYLADMHREETIERMRELYACAVSWVDWNVGRMLKALDDAGLRDDTLVLFTSDHGEMLGDLDTYQKFVCYDGSCRIPFVMRWPGKIGKGTVREEFVDLNDVLPTFAQLAGTAYPGSAELPGESLFAEHPLKDRSVVYAEHASGNRRHVMLRDREFKYIHNYGDRDELYDMVNDPCETEDLLWARADEHRVRQARDRLRKRLLEYEAKWGLEGCVEDGDFKKYPPMEIREYYETCYPTLTKRIRGDEDRLRPLEDEIFEAIKDEPLVRLSELDLTSLRTVAGWSEERVEALLERAKAEKRY